MGRNELADVAHKMLTLIRANGGAQAREELFVLLFRDAKTAELYQVVNHLIESGKLVRAMKGTREMFCLPDYAGLKKADPPPSQQPPAAT